MVGRAAAAVGRRKQGAQGGEEEGPRRSSLDDKGYTKGQDSYLRRTLHTVRSGAVLKMPDAAARGMLEAPKPRRGRKKKRGKPPGRGKVRNATATESLQL